MTDDMQPWVRWMINHKMVWIVKAVVISSFPIYFCYYLPEAISDFKHDLRRIK